MMNNFNTIAKPYFAEPGYAGDRQQHAPCAGVISAHDYRDAMCVSEKLGGVLPC